MVRAPAAAMAAPPTDIELEYCALDRRLKRVCSAATAERAACKNDIKHTREALLQYLQKHDAHRLKLPRGLVLRRRIHVTRNTITPEVYRRAWEACYKWGQVAPLLRDGFDFTTALEMVLASQVELEVRRTTEYADVVAEGGKYDVNNNEDKGDKNSNDNRVPDHILSLCQHLEDSKERDARVSSDAKAAAAPIRQRMKSLQQFILKLMGSTTRKRMDGGSVLCVKAATNAVPRIGVRAVRTAITPEIVKMTVTSPVSPQAVLAQRQLPRVSAAAVWDAAKATIGSFKQSHRSAAPPRLSVDKVRQKETVAAK